MTFAEICRSHEAGRCLDFKHPDLLGVMGFDEDGQLLFFDIHGRNICPPLWLSDFDRDDWVIVNDGVDRRGADRVDGFDRDDIGESPDY